MRTISVTPSMLNPFQRFVIAIARSTGFQPMGTAGIRQLSTLQGEFRRSTSERVFWYVFEGLAVCWGSWIVGFCVREYVSWGLTQWPTAAMGSVILSIGVFAITRNGRRRTGGSASSACAVPPAEGALYEACRRARPNRTHAPYHLRVSRIRVGAPPQAPLPSLPRRIRIPESSRSARACVGEARSSIHVSSGGLDWSASRVNSSSETAGASIAARASPARSGGTHR